MTSHDELRELTGAYVLGALGPDDRRRLEAHLDSCVRCRHDVVALSPLPGLLGRLTMEDLEGGEVPDQAAAVVAAARSDVRRLRTSRRRWRWAAGAAAVAAVVALVLSVVPGEEAPPSSDGVALALSSDAGIEGSIVADERAWGTYVHVALTDLPERESYELWLVDQAGAWHRAGTWGPTPEARANLGCSTELRLDEIRQLVITSGDRADELAVAV